MGSSAVLFYLISAFVLGTGLLAVTTRKIFRAAIWLLFSLTGVAGLYFWMHMQFIAAVQIVVYVGGIVVLIIFSIFLTQQSGKELPSPVPSRRWIAALAALAGFVLAASLICRYAFRPAPVLGREVDVSRIGTELLSASGYALPFEVVSVLLLAAMIGCIVLALKTEPINYDHE